MITPQEAYDICTKKVGHLRTEEFTKCGDYYLIDNAKRGDFVDDCYKVNSSTGEISKFNWLTDYKLLPEDESNDIEYLVKNGKVIA